MIRVSALQRIPAGFFAVCLFCAHSVCAQQQQDAMQAGTYPSPAGAYSSIDDSAQGASAPSETGLYPSASSGLAGQSASGLGNQATSGNSNSGSSKSVRANVAPSGWHIGTSGMGKSSGGAWIAGGDSFKATSSASWVAGQGDFGLQSQPGGIWRSLPTSVSEAQGIPSMSSEAPVPSSPPALNGAGPAHGSSSRLGFGPGSSGALGKSSNPLASHSRGSSSFGSMNGSSSSRQKPHSGSQPGSSLDDELNLNGSGSLDSGGLGKQ
jgi:hypothetical protein